MTGEFKEIQGLPEGPEPFEDGVLDVSLGFRSDVSPRLLELGFAEDLKDIRFEKSGFRKDFGDRPLGDFAASRILTIVEHKFIDDDGQHTRLVRLRKADDGRAKTEIWDGTEWIDDALGQFVIEDEDIGDGDGAVKNFTATLAETPVIASSVTIQDRQSDGTVDQEVTDDGAGNLVGDIDGAGANIINYTTGALDVTFAAAPADGNDIFVDYTSPHFISSTEPVRAVSVQGVLVFAPRGSPLLIRKEVIIWTSEGADFPPGNSLASLGDSIDAVIIPTDEVRGDEFTVHYDVDIVELTGGVEVDVGVKHNGDLIKSITYSGDTSLVNETQVLELPDLESEDTITLEIIDVRPTGTTSRSSGDFSVSGDEPDQEATKSETPEAVEDTYTFHFTVDTDDELSRTLEYWYNDGGGWVLHSTETFPPSFFGAVDREKIIDGLGAGAKFGLASQGIEDVTTYLINIDPVTWDESTSDYTIDIHGYNLGTDADSSRGVTWEFNSGLTVSLKTIPGAPESTWVESFADRLIALRDGVDSQAFHFSADGLVEEWVASDSGALFLLDTRNDPIDDLQSAAPLSSDVLAVLRARSIMRGFETGRFDQAVGVIPWIENLGTESPHSIATIPGGAVFLGHDNMVYILTEQGPVAIGDYIHEELIESLTSNTRLVDGVFDPVFQEYYLGIPEDGADHMTQVYVFDVGVFQRSNGQTFRWRKRSGNITRFGLASSLSVPELGAGGGGGDGAFIVTDVTLAVESNLGGDQVGLFDVSDPTAISHLNTFTVTNPRSISLSPDEDFLWVLRGSSILEGWNIANRSNPVQDWSLNWVNDLGLTNQTTDPVATLYLADQDWLVFFTRIFSDQGDGSFMVLYDVSDRHNSPTLLQWTEVGPVGFQDSTNQGEQAATRSGRRIYNLITHNFGASEDDAGMALKSISISVDGLSASVDAVDRLTPSSEGTPGDCVLNDDETLLAVSERVSGEINIYGVSDPTSPNLLSTITDYTVDVDGVVWGHDGTDSADRLYIYSSDEPTGAHGDANVRAYDVSDPANPVLVGDWRLGTTSASGPGWTMGLDPDGSVLYVMDNGLVSALDLSDEVNFPILSTSSTGVNVGTDLVTGFSPASTLQSA